MLPSPTYPPPFTCSFQRKVDASGMVMKIKGNRAFDARWFLRLHWMIRIGCYFYYSPIPYMHKLPAMPQAMMAGGPLGFGSMILSHNFTSYAVKNLDFLILMYRLIPTRKFQNIVCVSEYP